MDSMVRRGFSLSEVNYALDQAMQNRDELLSMELGYIPVDESEDNSPNNYRANIRE